MDTALFHTRKDIDRLIAETEALVTRDLEHGDRQRAMKRLRVPPLGEQLSPWITFKVGLFSGALFVLLVAVVISGKQLFYINFLRNILTSGIIVCIFQVLDTETIIIGAFCVDYIVDHC